MDVLREDADRLFRVESMKMELHVDAEKTQDGPNRRGGTTVQVLPRIGVESALTDRVPLMRPRRRRIRRRAVQAIMFSLFRSAAALNGIVLLVVVSFLVGKPELPKQVFCHTDHPIPMQDEVPQDT